MRQCVNVLYVQGLIVFLRVSVTVRKSTNKCRYAFSFLVAQHLEHQSSKTRLFLPKIPINIVASWVLFYAFLGQPLLKQLYMGVPPGNHLIAAHQCCILLIPFGVSQ